MKDILMHNTSEKFPKFGQRVLISAPKDLRYNDSSFMCATYQEKIENKSGVYHKWQIENEQSKIVNIEWWCELPDEPTF